jgi:DEAD_2
MRARSPRHNGVESFAKARPDLNSQPLDVEELVALGRGGRCCPYYLSRDMAASADIVLMPYNYLVDPRTRSGMTGVAWKGAVVIFDEAHNVEVMRWRRPGVNGARPRGDGQTDTQEWPPDTGYRPYCTQDTQS